MTLVPFRRYRKLGQRGYDVEAIQRTLRQLGIRKAPRTGYYGAGTRDQIKRYQHLHGIFVDGVYGPKTHDLLRRRFDATSHALYLKGWDLNRTKRARVVKAAMHGYNVRSGIHYTQHSWSTWLSFFGRMFGVRHKTSLSGIPRYEDCSSFATWTHWFAGLADPNGLHYNGYGFTGTLTAHGSLRNRFTVEPADLVFYGSPVSHVAIYVGNGRVVSHGSEGGPYLLPIGYRSINHIRSYL